MSGKQALAAHAMVNAIFAGRVERIFVATGADRGAGIMEAFWREWNAQMWDGR